MKKSDLNKIEKMVELFNEIKTLQNELSEKFKLDFNDAVVEMKDIDNACIRTPTFDEVVEHFDFLEENMNFEEVDGALEEGESVVDEEVENEEQRLAEIAQIKQIEEEMDLLYDQMAEFAGTTYEIAKQYDEITSVEFAIADDSELDLIKDVLVKRLGVDLETLEKLEEAYSNLS